MQIPIFHEDNFINSPKSRGFSFPAEWHKHTATWFTFPHTDASWQGKKRALMMDNYISLMAEIAKNEQVCINVNDENIKIIALQLLENKGVALNKIEILINPTNDSWARDHGPAFLINNKTNERLIVNWEYNAWGGKYPPFDADNNLPVNIAKYRNLEYVSPGIIMEGGSVEFNGAGTILTSKSCLLNKNRNPHLNQGQIERYLYEFYGAEQILWIEDGIVGDDTDGHIDDTVRFVNNDTVVTVIENNKADENFEILHNNKKMLQSIRLLDGKQLNIVELPMPNPVVIDNFRVPASYANFLICNTGVLVPTYRCKNDIIALDILTKVFKNKPVIGLDSFDIIWGQGSFHCLSQQEPSM